MMCVHFVGFRGDEYWSAVKVFGKPHFIHKDNDVRVYTEVGDNDVVVFGAKYKHTDYVWDASAVDNKWSD
jgi:hypothetical protein